jgi:hypothetical protein
MDKEISAWSTDPSKQSDTHQQLLLKNETTKTFTKYRIKNDTNPENNNNFTMASTRVTKFVLLTLKQSPTEGLKLLCLK